MIEKEVLDQVYEDLISSNTRKRSKVLSLIQSIKGKLNQSHTDIVKRSILNKCLDQTMDDLNDKNNIINESDYQIGDPTIPYTELLAFNILDQKGTYALSNALGDSYETFLNKDNDNPLQMYADSVKIVGYGYILIRLNEDTIFAQKAINDAIKLVFA